MRFMQATRHRTFGRAPDVGPCAHVLKDTAEVQRCPFDRVFNLKGKSAVRIHRWILGNKRATGLHFWSRGYCVSTVGLDEETIRKYIRDQEKADQQQRELDLK